MTAAGLTAAPAAVDEATPFLSLRDLAVELGGREVLRGVDLDLRAGEFVGLIGPNGAGKTTLLRSVMGLIPTRSGRIAVGGREAIGRGCRARGRAAAAGVGYVPQRHEFAWDFPVSIQDAVLTGRVASIGWLRRASVADYRAVAAALDRVGLLDLRSRPVGELSGGQRQRVLVARALAVQPRVLLLDEPFTGLDMPTQELLTSLFRDLAADGQALLMTTHDLASALATCTRLCLLNRTVIADGTPDDIRDASLWRQTFEVGEHSPLLAALGVA